MKLARYEQETIISFNAGERNASLYTRDRGVMKKMDELVSKYPDIYQIIKETEIDKEYSFTKNCIRYFKPHKISATKREQARMQMRDINSKKYSKR